MAFLLKDVAWMALLMLKRAHFNAFHALKRAAFQQGMYEALLPEIHGDALALIQKVFLFSALPIHDLKRLGVS